MGRAGLVALALLVASCGNKPPATMMGNGVGPFRGLRALPRQLAFTCVVPGCDTILVVKVQSTVNRRVAIKRVVLSKESTTEYTITPSQATPFILGAASDFSVDVKYLPVSAPGADDLKVLVTYTDASPDGDDPDRIEPGELEIPLIRRLVGEPALDINPKLVSFGLVPPGQSKTLPVTAKNVGFGNIALAVDKADAGNGWVSVTLPTFSALVPDAGASIDVKFSPTMRGYYRGDVIIGSTTPAVGEVSFEVEGTSFIDGVLTVEPEERSIDFGDVPRRQMRTITVQAANLGGAPISLNSVTVADPSNNVRGALPNGMTSVTIPSLGRVPITLTLDATRAGIVDAKLQLASSDAARPLIEVPIRGTVTEPRLEVSPTMLAWGNTPLGWQVVKPVELRNVGFGPLTIRRVVFVGGTSNLYSLRNAPALPATIATGGRASIEVEFRADAMSMFGGSLSIESDDVMQQILEIPLSANGVSCNAGCAVANATPSCMNGQCAIGMCNPGYYNTDGMASNGCECHETGTDPSSFCSMGEYKGNLKDTSGQTAQHVGMVPLANPPGADEGDVDWIRFHAEDATNVFSDDFDVRINLSTTDPDIEMCIYRKGGTSHDTSCYQQGETCGIRSYRRDGSIGSEDGADFDIKIRRRENSAGQCTTYTLTMSNG
jgi:hypothetical protein